MEETLRDKEAIEAENAAVDAKLAENEAVIRGITERTRELEAMHTAQASHARGACVWVCASAELGAERTADGLPFCESDSAASRGGVCGVHASAVARTMQSV